MMHDVCVVLGSSLVFLFLLLYIDKKKRLSCFYFITTSFVFVMIGIFSSQCKTLNKIWHKSERLACALLNGMEALKIRWGFTCNCHMERIHGFMEIFWLIGVRVGCQICTPLTTWIYASRRLRDDPWQVCWGIRGSKCRTIFTRLSWLNGLENRATFDHNEFSLWLWDDYSLSKLSNIKKLTLVFIWTFTKLYPLPQHHVCEEHHQY